MKKKLTCTSAWGMTAKKSLLEVLFLLLSGFSAFAQVSVHGKIQDEKGTPLSGATIQVKGTSQFTQSDEKGDFSLSVPSANSRLVFSYSGYLQKEITVSNHSNFNVTLVQSGTAMGEVVVIGYGTQRKSDLTGAISSIGAKDLAKATPINATEAMQGRAAGVMVTTNSGSPGSEGSIRIRGIGTVNNNDPLYVVDGMFVSSINYLNPSDIARLEVLKDASATAIYGSRGANGVVLITTHKGSTGKPVIVFNANTSLSKVSNLMKTLNSDQHFDYQKTAYLNGYFRAVPTANPNTDPFTSNDPFFNYLKSVKAQYDKGYYTNWADSLYKTAVVQSYDLGIRGGAQNIRYAASGGYFDQKGILQNSSYRRYTFRLNTDYTINKRLVIGENLSITNSSTLGMGGYGEGRANSLVPQIIGASPLIPIINPNANVNDPDYQYNKYASDISGGGYNPAASIARVNDKINILKLVGNVFGELNLLKGLKLRTSFGYDYNSIDSSGFNPRFFISANEQNPTSLIAQTDNYYFGQVWENTLSYNTKLGAHSISGLLGYTEELYKGKFTNASRQGTASNDPSLQVLNAATGPIALTGNKTQTSLQSYFARANYSYDDKYLLTATVRRDGSSKFAAANRWGTFPSASAGWRISNEKFFQNLKATFISSLKLRAGWGQIGNQSMPGGSNNPYLSLVEGYSGYRYIFGDALANGNYLTSLGTPSISWETSQQTNIGLDLTLFSLFKNSLTFSADYYVKNTKNMLLQVPLSSYAGFPGIPYTNAGNIQNKGFEVIVAYEGSAGNFTYGVSSNVSKFINKAVSLGTGDKPIATTDQSTNLSANRTEVGRAIGELYGWVTDGIFQTAAEVQAYNKNGQLIQPNALPGDFRFKDLNGDGVINASDKTSIGNPWPKLTYGSTLTLGYKGFDLSVLFQGAFGNKLFNVNKKYNNVLNGLSGANLKAYEAAWRGEGTSNTQPIMSTVDRNDNFRVSDWYVEDGSYLRLKNLQVGYKVPETWLNKVGISSSRIWIGGTNLFTITKYTGNDPEAGLTANPLQAGWEFSPYPKMKRFSLGINLTF